MAANDAASRIAHARSAQAGWAQLSPTQRATALRPLRHAIAQRIDQIIETISSEVGKPPMDALAGDIMVTLEHLGFYERATPRILRRRKIARSRLLFSGTRFEEVMEPHGVVLICAPWNYPLQLSVVPMATALFAGNAVLLKCSELTPRTAQLIADLCTAANLPPNLVQVSCEAPLHAEALLAAGPDLVFFSGSNRNGRTVAAKAAEQVIPTVMELGGKDAALVFDSCDLRRTVNGIVYGSFSNAGQVCVGIKRIYVQHSIYENFIRLFLERAAQLRTGTTIDSDVSPIRIEAVQSRLRDQIQDATARGAKLHTPTHDGNAPIILTEVPADASLLLEESFGPVVCVAPFTTEPEAIAAANSSAFALSASIWTRDRAQAHRVALQLHTGTCAIDDVIRNIGNPHAAFGGNQSSGFGRYHGDEGLRTFSRIKTIMTSTRTSATEVHWFPFQSKTFSQLRTLLQIRHARSLRDRIKALTGLRMLLPLLVCGACLAASTTSQNTLALDVTLPPHAPGQIACLVVANPDGFPDGTSFTFPPGRYAVSLYLGENGNHKLDKNWLGRPKDAVGVSNHHCRPTEAPHFDGAFTPGPSPESIPISIV